LHEQELRAKVDFDAKRAAVGAFNAQHTWRKRGLCMLPIA